jgi:PIN domain nuclease of toxin-antitoxin system
MVFGWRQKKVPNKIRKEINNGENGIVVSIASIWELAIKLSLKKIETKINLQEIQAEILKREFTLLGISFDHLNALSTLSQAHGDPFDRLLIAQAIAEGLTIISADRQFKNYHVEVIWQ